MMRVELSQAVLVAQKICPRAPGDAQKYVDQMTGYVLWGVSALFFIAAVVGVGAIVGGRVISMPHASKVGVISLVVVFVAVIAYFTAPAVIQSMLGNGCI